MIRALVTGCRGQVGAEVARELQGRAEVLAFDRAGLDLNRPADIAARIRDLKPQLIVNAAAYTAVDRAETEVDTARAVNATAPGLIAAEAKRVGALLVHFSTDYVFDGRKPAPYVESDPTHPINAYGLTKLEGERAIEASGCDHLILRTSWVYGPRGANFVATMLRLAQTRSELRVVDDQRGAPTSSLQLARALRELLAGDGDGEIGLEAVERLAAASGLYHASAAGETTWFDFARAIFSARSRRPGAAFVGPRVIAIPTREYPTPARRPANSLLSNGRLAATFGLSLPSWQSGLEETLSAMSPPA